MKKKLIITSILSMVMCVSLIIGATFALFTSEDNVNIAVTSGKVNVTAHIDENSVQTKQLYTEYQRTKKRTGTGYLLHSHLPTLIYDSFFYMFFLVWFLVIHSHNYTAHNSHIYYKKEIPNKFAKHTTQKAILIFSYYQNHRYGSLCPILSCHDCTVN